MPKYQKIPKELQKKRGRKPLNDAPAITDQAAPAITDQAAPAITDQAAPAITDQSAPAITDQAAPAITDQAAPVATDPLEIAEKLHSPGKDIPDELSNLLDEYNANEPEPVNDDIPVTHQEIAEAHEVPPPKVNLIRGYMLLLILDFVFPTGITLAFRKFGGDRFKDLKIKDIRLTDQEFKDLEPVADEVAKDIQLNVSPLTQLMVGMAVIYSSKLMFRE